MSRQAEVIYRTYSSGRPFFTAECRPCGVVLNSGHHWLDEAGAQAAADRHNDERHCFWLVRVGWTEDGDEVLDVCGAGGLSEHDGLCPRHTRGMSLEAYHAPFGPAWEEEQRDRY